MGHYVRRMNNTIGIFLKAILEDVKQLQRQKRCQGQQNSANPYYAAERFMEEIMHVLHVKITHSSSLCGFI